MINLTVHIKITKVERIQPILSTHKVGDTVETTYGPEIVHVTFDNNLAIDLQPDIFDALGWKVGDTIKATLGRTEA